jgi:hypothetical protein
MYIQWVVTAYRFSIYIKKPEARDHTLSQLLKPLATDLWRAICVTMVLITIMLSVLWRALRKQEACAYSLHTSAFYVFAVFSQAGEQLGSVHWLRGLLRNEYRKITGVKRGRSDRLTT